MAWPRFAREIRVELCTVKQLSYISMGIAGYLVMLIACGQQIAHDFEPHDHPIAEPASPRAFSQTPFPDRPEFAKATQQARVIADQKGSQIGKWGSVFATPALAIHVCELPDYSVMMHDGKLVHDTDGAIAGADTPTNVMFFDIRTRQLLRRQQASQNLFCGAQTTLSNGNVALYSGDVRGDAAGHTDASEYDWKTRRFMTLPNLPEGSWYGTATELRNGEVALLGGGNSSGTLGNAKPQMLSQDKKSWYVSEPRLPFRTINESYYSRVFWDELDRLWAVGGHSTTFHIQFPGRTIYNPVDQRIPTRDLEVVTDKDGVFRDYAPATEPMTGVVWQGGGSLPPTETTSLQYIGKVNRHNPGDWQLHQPMWFARRHHNGSTLPDGTVLVSGGVHTDGYAKSWLIKNAELWNPTTGQWSLLSPEQVGRTYHSTAWLSTDGLWWSCGGNIRSGFENENPASGAGNQRNCQVFTPPQKFVPNSDLIAPVPEILDEVSPINLAQSKGLFKVKVGTISASQISEAALIPLGCTTHAFTTPSYRRTASVVSANTQTQTLDLQLETTNPAIMRPGYYKLFLLYQQPGATYQTWGPAKIIQVVER